MTQPWQPQNPTPSTPPTGPVPPASPVMPTVSPAADPASQATPPRAPKPAVPSTAFPAWGDRFVAPEEEAPEPETEPRNLLLPALAGLVLLGVIAGALWWIFLGRPQNGPGTEVIASHSAAVTVKKPDEVVRQYLNALAEGRIDDALALGPVGVGSRAALTPAAMERSRQTMSISDIQVGQVDDAATEVPARYTIGGERVSTTIKVRRQADATWQLASSTVTLRITGVRSKDVPVLVNGMEVGDAQQVEVVPGYYVVTTGLPFIDYDAGTEARVTTLDTHIEIPRLTTVVTPEGNNALLAAGRASLDSCLRQTTLAPAGCPFGGQVSGSVVPGSVQWSLADDVWAGYAPRLEPTTGIATAPLTLRTDLTFALDGGRRSQQTVVTNTALQADLTVREARDIKVSWQRL